MSNAEDQQFCLRWNNFQANITSQFETLRDDEDFVDVTLACEGQRLEAHKVVLSACSPFFKELFKSNPCPHPIIFMRDVEARHIIALLEFMYAGEVNVSQAHLSGFLRTAESLQIRGLTDASKAHKIQPKSTDGQEQSMCNVQQSQSNRSLVNKSNLCTTSTKSLSPQPNIKSLKSEHSTTKQHLNVSSIETTVTDEKSQKSNKNPSPSSSPTPAKRQCKETITENILSENNRLDDKTESEDVPQKSSGNMNINPFATLHQTQFRDVHSELDLEADIVEPKVELPDYASDEEMRAESRMTESILGLDGPDTDQLSNIRGGMDILSGSSSLNIAEMSQESLQAAMTSDPRKPHCLDPQPCPVCGRVYSNMSNLRQHMRLIHHPQNVTCPLCSKQFKTSLYLKRHLVGYHNTAVEPGTTNISLPQNVTDIKHNIYNKPPARTDNLNIGFHGSNQNFNVSSSQNVMEIKETVYGKKIDSNVGYQNNRTDTKISSSNNSDIGVFPNNHNLNLESMQTHNFECKDGNIGGYHQNTPRYNTNNFELQTNQTDMTERTF